LTLQLWKELGGHWPRFSKAYPKAETVQLRVRLEPGTEEAEKWAIIGYACGVEAGAESATRAQGFHAPHMLILGEEAPGIPPAVMTAHENTSGGGHNLRMYVGNPDHQLDSLHRHCISPGVRHIRISSYDHPNVVTGYDVIPGAISRKGIDKLAYKWGEGSPMFESRVRGISPAEAVNALIKLEWCKQAALKWKDAKYREGLGAMGVDVAQSENGDKAAIALGKGACLEEVQSFPCDNATELGTTVVTMASTHGISLSNVGVDPIGVGAATVNEIRKTSPLVQALNGANNPIRSGQKTDAGLSLEWVPDANNFSHLRSQMYWQMREDLRNGRIALPNDEALFRELTVPTYETRGGKVVVEPKEEIKKRLGGASPDRADAVVYWNWVRPRKAEPKIEDQQKKEDFHPGFDLKTRQRKTFQNAYDRQFGGGDKWRTPTFKRPRDDE
jgi:hypothetical protein